MSTKSGEANKKKEKLEPYVEPPQYWPELSKAERVLKVRIITTILTSKAERADCNECLERIAARASELPTHIARMNVRDAVVRKIGELNL